MQAAMTASLPVELETIADVVRWAASRFEHAGLAYGHGTDTAIDEAAALVLHTLHLPPDLHAAYFPCRITVAEKQALAERIERRINERLPLPYLTGEAWFAGLAFEVDERVLVPRSPIAELIARGFEPWKDADAIARVADVGTGSGCIAVACALAMPWVRVDALDVSPAALAVARRNIERHGVGDRVMAVQSDLFEAIPAARRYDLIVSNPPYVDADAMAAMPAEYRREPAIGLAAGEDGLASVRTILNNAAAYLAPDGVLVVEVGDSQRALERARPDLPFVWLEFEHGGSGVFLLTAGDLQRAGGATTT